MKNRGVSIPLQKVIIDFGADVSFGEAVKKIFGHYGVSLHSTTVRTHTLTNAEKMLQKSHDLEEVYARNPNKTDKILTTETDSELIESRTSNESPQSTHAHLVKNTKNPY